MVFESVAVGYSWPMRVVGIIIEGSGVTHRILLAARVKIKA